jgi:hypothetical protein
MTKKKPTKKKLIDLTYKVLRHWENNVVFATNGRGYCRKDENCAYCKEYVRAYTIDPCFGCPVYIDTLSHGCHDTPWIYTVAYALEPTWNEFQYLLNVAYSQGLESKYMEEL